MPLRTPPFIHLGIDASTGKSYHICSRKSLLSFGAILLLIVAMSSERFLFKVMIDRMESYSVFYMLAAIPGSVSMLYKERVIRDQPVDMAYLNAWVSVNQFVAGLLAAPLVFDAEMGLTLLLLYVLSNIVVNLLLLQLIRLTSVSTMYGSTLVGFLASFVVLAWYQVDPDDFIDLHDGLRNWIPPSVFVDVFAFLIIFAGKVLYQWDADPAVEATTLSAEDKEAASLLNDDDYGLRYT
ncbi:hypothetical protein BBJ28_00019095 [Nothophytophthora sp. Chile5]|nr:hypothetical protein BBJ28_00019095 [Nothophytophthora sp. Chile5]